MKAEKEGNYLDIEPVKPNYDVFVVIRSAGEATEALCRSLLVDQAGEENVKVIREKPFVKAVRKNFELGIKAGKKWTLAIDADILIRENAVRELTEWANKQEDYFFELQGRVVDKYFCAPRPGGPHLYRTKYLEQALTFLPEDKNALRPESYTYQKMADKGYHYYHHPEIYGIHDYFQHPKEIYRKAFLHAHKHQQHIGYFVKQWAKYQNTDSDYAIALKGLIDGLGFMDKVEVDVDFFRTHVDKNLQGFENKNASEDHITYEINHIMQSWAQDQDALAFEQTHLALYRRSDLLSRKKKASFLSKVLLRLANTLNKAANYATGLANK